MHGGRNFHGVFSYVLVAFSLYFIVSLAIDYLLPFIYKPGFLEVDAEIVIVDVEGIVKDKVLLGKNMVLLNGISVADFRVLGLVKSKVIVFIAHGLEVRNGGFALETSEDSSIATPFLYPLMTLTRSIVRGVVPRQPEKVAVTSTILDYSASFEGKIVVLLTCGGHGVREFAERFLSHGASMVIFTEKPLPAEQARQIARDIVEALAEGIRDPDYYKMLGLSILSKVNYCLPII